MSKGLKALWNSFITRMCLSKSSLTEISITYEYSPISESVLSNPRGPLLFIIPTNIVICIIKIISPLLIFLSFSVFFCFFFLFFFLFFVFCFFFCFLFFVSKWEKCIHVPKSGTLLESLLDNPVKLSERKRKKKEKKRKRKKEEESNEKKIIKTKSDC